MLAHVNTQNTRSDLQKYWNEIRDICLINIVLQTVACRRLVMPRTNYMNAWGQLLELDYSSQLSFNIICDWMPLSDIVVWWILISTQYDYAAQANAELIKYTHGGFDQSFSTHSNCSRPSPSHLHATACRDSIGKVILSRA